jgi:hypothetical protein
MLPGQLMPLRYTLDLVTHGFPGIIIRSARVGLGEPVIGLRVLGLARRGSLHDGQVAAGTRDTGAGKVDHAEVERTSSGDFT